MTFTHLFFAAFQEFVHAMKSAAQSTTTRPASSLPHRFDCPKPPSWLEALLALSATGHVADDHPGCYSRPGKGAPTAKNDVGIAPDELRFFAQSLWVWIRHHLLRQHPFLRSKYDHALAQFGIDVQESRFLDPSDCWQGRVALEAVWHVFIETHEKIWKQLHESKGSTAEGSKVKYPPVSEPGSEGASLDAQAMSELVEQFLRQALLEALPQPRLMKRTARGGNYKERAPTPMAWYAKLMTVGKGAAWMTKFRQEHYDATQMTPGGGS